MSISRITPNFQLKSIMFPNTKHKPRLNTITPTSVSFNQIMNGVTTNNSRTGDIKIIRESYDGPLIIMQTRPQSYEEYINNTHDERDLIPTQKKIILFSDVEAEDHIAIIAKDDNMITSSQQWLLNQRQGDNPDQIGERNGVRDVPPISNGSYNQSPDLEEGKEYWRSVEYEHNEIEENGSKSYPPSILAPQYNPQTFTKENTFFKPYSYSQDILTASSQPLNLSERAKSQPVVKGIPQINLQPIPAPITPIEQAEGVSLTKIQPIIRGIPQINLRPMPGSITTTTEEPLGMLRTATQVGMSESLLQMNIPLFLQNNIGPDASWT